MDGNWNKDPAFLTGFFMPNHKWVRFFMPNPLSVPTKQSVPARLEDLPVGFWDF